MACFLKFDSDRQNTRLVKHCSTLILQEFEVSGYVIQKWNDFRLRNLSTETITLKEDKSIWVADAYCVNCRSTTLGSQNKQLMIRINPAGDIYYSQGYVNIYK